MFYGHLDGPNLTVSRCIPVCLNILELVHYVIYVRPLLASKSFSEASIFICSLLLIRYDLKANFFDVILFSDWWNFAEKMFLN